MTLQLMLSAEIGFLSQQTWKYWSVGRNGCQKTLLLVF